MLVMSPLNSMAPHPQHQHPAPSSPISMTGASTTMVPGSPVSPRRKAEYIKLKDLVDLYHIDVSTCVVTGGEGQEDKENKNQEEGVEEGGTTTTTAQQGGEAGSNHQQQQHGSSSSPPPAGTNIGDGSDSVDGKSDSRSKGLSGGGETYVHPTPAYHRYHHNHHHAPPSPGREHYGGMRERKKSLNAPSGGFNLCLLVGKVNLVVDKLRVDRSRVRLAEVLVGDESGTVSLRARDEQIDLLQALSTTAGSNEEGGVEGSNNSRDHAVVLRNCTIELFQNKHLRLAVTKWGKMTAYPDHVPSTPEPPRSMDTSLNFSLADLTYLSTFRRGSSVRGGDESFHGSNRSIGGSPIAASPQLLGEKGPEYIGGGQQRRSPASWSNSYPPLPSIQTGEPASPPHIGQPQLRGQWKQQYPLLSHSMPSLEESTSRMTLSPTTKYPSARSLGGTGHRQSWHSSSGHRQQRRSPQARHGARGEGERHFMDQHGRTDLQQHHHYHHHQQQQYSPKFQGTPPSQHAQYQQQQQHVHAHQFMIPPQNYNQQMYGMVPRTQHEPPFLHPAYQSYLQQHANLVAQGEVQGSSGGRGNDRAMGGTGGGPSGDGGGTQSHTRVQGPAPGGHVNTETTLGGRNPATPPLVPRQPGSPYLYPFDTTPKGGMGMPDRYAPSPTFSPARLPPPMIPEQRFGGQRGRDVHTDGQSRSLDIPRTNEASIPGGGGGGRDQHQQSSTGNIGEHDREQNNRRHHPTPRDPISWQGQWVERSPSSSSLDAPATFSVSSLGSFGAMNAQAQPYDPVSSVPEYAKHPASMMHAHQHHHQPYHHPQGGYNPYYTYPPPPPDANLMYGQAAMYQQGAMAYIPNQAGDNHNARSGNGSPAEGN